MKDVTPVLRRKKRITRMTMVGTGNIYIIIDMSFVSSLVVHVHVQESQCITDKKDGILHCRSNKIISFHMCEKICFKDQEKYDYIASLNIGNNCLCFNEIKNGFKKAKISIELIFALNVSIILCVILGMCIFCLCKMDLQYRCLNIC